MIEATIKIISHHHILNGPPVWTFRISTHGLADNARIESVVEYGSHHEALAGARRTARLLWLTVVSDEADCAAHAQPVRGEEQQP